MVAQKYSVKKAFLKISQNSPENTCARASILIISIKKSLWHGCFPVKFAKFLRTSFLTEHLQWLVLRAPNFVSVPRLCTIQNISNFFAKAYLRTPFLQNRSQWLLSNVSYFCNKGRHRNNFSYLL